MQELWFYRSNVISSLASIAGVVTWLSIDRFVVLIVVTLLFRTLADVDKDGRLTSEEFSVALFLVDMAKMGQPLPLTLPPNLIPPSMGGSGVRSRSNSAVQPAGEN